MISADSSVFALPLQWIQVGPSFVLDKEGSSLSRNQNVLSNAHCPKRAPRYIGNRTTFDYLVMNCIYRVHDHHRQYSTQILMIK